MQIPKIKKAALSAGQKYRWVPSFAALCLASGTSLAAQPEVEKAVVADVKSMPVQFQVLPDAGKQNVEIRELLERVIPQLGKPPQSISELDHWSEKLTEVLRKGGFPVGQVLMTQQDWILAQRNGVWKFSVFPGRLDKIVIQNHTRVKDRRLEKLVAWALCSTGNIEQSTCLLQTSRIERATELLQDVPGVALNMAPQFGPGNGAGNVSVIFDLEQQGKPGQIGVILDNQGTDSTGAIRAGLSYSGNNVLGLGEAYAVSATVTDKRMWTGSAQGSIPLGDDGLRLTGGASVQRYDISSGLEVSGVAATGQMGISYPFVRGLDRNIWGGVQVLHTQTRSSYGFTDATTTTHSRLDSTQLFVQGNNGDRAIQLRDNPWSASGALTLGHQSNDDFLDAGPHRAGNYAKYSFNTSNMFALSKDRDTFISVRTTGQVASRNLDFSEKLSLGGPNAVRAYRPDEVSVDDGVLVNAGLYRRFQVRPGHQLQLGIFTDFARGRINHSPWANWESGYVGIANVTNMRTLAGYGVSADWLTPVGATVSISASRPYSFSGSSWVEPGKKPTQIWTSITWNH